MSAETVLPDAGQWLVDTADGDAWLIDTDAHTVARLIDGERADEAAHYWSARAAVGEPLSIDVFIDPSGGAGTVTVSAGVVLGIYRARPAASGLLWEVAA